MNDVHPHPTAADTVGVIGTSDSQAWHGTTAFLNVAVNVSVTGDCQEKTSKGRGLLVCPTMPTLLEVPPT